MPNIKSIIIFLAICCTTSQVLAAGIFFDAQQRKALLQTPAYAEAKKLCMADNVKWNDKLPKPIMGLKTTEGYGGDNRPSKFSWYVMVLTGRTMAGDMKSTKLLKAALLSWARAKALTESDDKHDTYYELKRYMLPIVVSLSVIEDKLSSVEKKEIVNWIDSIVPKLDKKFDGDVDLNNHRYLANSVLMAWGAYKQDARLYNIGKKGFVQALDDARTDGSLPLETRRGARATWYMRHALSSLVTAAEIDKAHGGDLYKIKHNGNSLASIINYFITANYAPLIITPHSAENYIAGPHKDFLHQDTGYMHRRGNRHYMAFAEAYIHQPSLAAKRLYILMQNKTEWKQRPYIDEYVGGNASCFFWQPKGN